MIVNESGLVSGELFALYRRVYICILYTPNLGFEFAVSVREKEQGRFRGSSEGAARGSTGGARRSTGEHRGSTGGVYGSEPTTVFWPPGYYKGAV